jgi:hypothetical protein
MAIRPFMPRFAVTTCYNTYHLMRIWWGTLKTADLHPDVFLWLARIDAAYEEHRANGAKIVEAIADRPWDARQYVVEDPNGYRLKFAEPLDD